MPGGGRRGRARVGDDEVVEEVRAVGGRGRDVHGEDVRAGLEPLGLVEGDADEGARRVRDGRDVLRAAVDGVLCHRERPGDVGDDRADDGDARACEIGGGGGGRGIAGCVRVWAWVRNAELRVPDGEDAPLNGAEKLHLGDVMSARFCLYADFWMAWTASYAGVEMTSETLTYWGFMANATGLSVLSMIVVVEFATGSAIEHGSQGGGGGAGHGGHYATRRTASRRKRGRRAMSLAHRAWTARRGVRRRTDHTARRPCRLAACLANTRQGVRQKNLFLARFDTALADSDVRRTISDHRHRRPPSFYACAAPVDKLSTMSPQPCNEDGWQHL